MPLPALHHPGVHHLQVQPELAQRREGAGAGDGHPGEQVLVAEAGLELHAAARDVDHPEVDEVTVADGARGDAGGEVVAAAGPAGQPPLLARRPAARLPHAPAQRQQLAASFALGEEDRRPRNSLTLSPSRRVKVLN